MNPPKDPGISSSESTSKWRNLNRYLGYRWM